MAVRCLRFGFAGKGAGSMSANILIRTFVLLALCFAIVSAAQASPAASTSCTSQKVLGVWAHVVTIDLNDNTLEVGIALARGGLRTSEPFGSMVSRTKPIAAITGTFFCTRSLAPVGDVVIDGHIVCRGTVGACLAFAPDNKVRISSACRGDRSDWTGIVAGVRSGPQLLSGGVIKIDARKEGFRDKGLFGRRVRSAIGVTPQNKLLLVAVKTPVTFGELAKVMRRLGATEAVNLDGGSSTALSYGDKIVVRPARRLTNLIVVSRRRPFIAPSALPQIAAQPSSPQIIVTISGRQTEPPVRQVVIIQSSEQPASLPENLTGRALH
jgi:exopolysaccharide biosynthesis protein